MVDGKSTRDVQAWRRKWGWIGLSVVAVTVAETCVYSAAVGPRPWWSAACGGLLACAAPFAFGALIGFLFGIPRTLQVESPAHPTPSATPGQTLTNGDSATSYRVNTNLEQISDWLTKILVGVGLTQFKEIPPRIWSIASKSASVYGSGPSAQGIAALVLVTFLIAGFFVGYLTTRLILAPAFKDVESPDPQMVERLYTSPVDFGKGEGKAVGAHTDDVEGMLKYRLDELTAPNDIAAWAKAQMARMNFSDALAGYGKALKLAPNDPQILQGHAAALTASRNYGRAHTELERAASLVATPQDRQRVTEGLILTSLYDDPPDGFGNAIRYGEQYVAEPGARPSAAIEAWLGAAYGQKYRWLQSKQPPPPQADLDAARSASLTHVRKSLQLDPTWRKVLAGLLTPTQEGGDDDLETFKDDPEFRKLLLG